jgi:hypothetical protein
VPFIEALGCSTPEARLMMAEGKAAVRNRRRGRQNRAVNEEENATTFDPRDHLKYLDHSYRNIIHQGHKQQRPIILGTPPMLQIRAPRQ